MRKSFLILLLTALFLSCQDTKSNDTTTQKAEEKHQVSEEVSEDKTEPLDERSKYGLDTITKLKQEELIPFYTKYAEEEQQTKAVIHTDFGDIEIELFKDTPLHRANFIRQTKNGYFNTTYFYRVDPGFVIQAGNSDNAITSKMRKTIGSFLIPNEFKSAHKNDYGAVAAAKYSEQNVSKASSPYEFYIVMDKEGSHHLDNEHTVFGKVTKGMEVAEKISKVKTGDSSEWPVDNVEIEIEMMD